MVATYNFGSVYKYEIWEKLIFSYVQRASRENLIFASDQGCMGPSFCICRKAHISSVTTQVDQSLCFFATLIENHPALIKKFRKIFNPKFKKNN